MAEDRPIVLYPAYFDLKRTRQEGRRVPKSLAVDGPTAEEIEKAAKALGLSPKIEADRAYPSSHWRKEGRVLVQAGYYKTPLIPEGAGRIKGAPPGAGHPRLGAPAASPSFLSAATPVHAQRSG